MVTPAAAVASRPFPPWGEALNSQPLWASSSSGQPGVPRQSALAPAFSLDIRGYTELQESSAAVAHRMSSFWQQHEHFALARAREARSMQSPAGSPSRSAPWPRAPGDPRTFETSDVVLFETETPSGLPGSHAGSLYPAQSGEPRAVHASEPWAPNEGSQHACMGEMVAFLRQRIEQQGHDFAQLHGEICYKAQAAQTFRSARVA